MTSIASYDASYIAAQIAAQIAETTPTFVPPCVLVDVPRGDRAQGAIRMARKVADSSMFVAGSRPVCLDWVFGQASGGALIGLAKTAEWKSDHDTDENDNGGGLRTRVEVTHHT